MKCSRCGAENPDDVRFCIACGAPLDASPVSEGTIGPKDGEAAVDPSPVTPVPGTAPAQSFSPAPQPADPGYAQPRPQRSTAHVAIISAAVAVAVCAGVFAAFLAFTGSTSSTQEAAQQSTIRVESAEDEADEKDEAETTSNRERVLADAAKEDEADDADDQNVEATPQVQDPAPQPAPAPEPEPEPAQEPVASASGKQPFWGVWIGAFSDEAGARARASEAASRGFNAAVYYSADWTNLNQAGYWVVTCGANTSEADAQAVLSQALTYYGDAYVKYSGSWQG